MNDAAQIAAELDGAASMLTSGDSFNPEELGEALADLAAEIRADTQKQKSSVGYTAEQFAALPAWARKRMIDLENQALHNAVKRTAYMLRAARSRSRLIRTEEDQLRAHFDDITGKSRELVALFDSNTTDPDERVNEAASMVDLASEIQAAASELLKTLREEYESRLTHAKTEERKHHARN